MSEWLDKNRIIEALKMEGLKGKSKGGLCNVTACQKPGAYYWNRSTRAYYCENCAKEINWPGGRKDTRSLYGIDMLCVLDGKKSNTFMLQQTECWLEKSIYHHSNNNRLILQPWCIEISPDVPSRVRADQVLIMQYQNLPSLITTLEREHLVVPLNIVGGDVLCKMLF